MSKRTKKHRDPLAGIPPELQVKMRVPAWRAAFNAPLTPERAAKAMPPVDVLALMLDRWLKFTPERRRLVLASFFFPYGCPERAGIDLLKALEGVIADASVLCVCGHPRHEHTSNYPNPGLGCDHTELRKPAGTPPKGKTWPKINVGCPCFDFTPANAQSADGVKGGAK